MNRSCMLAVILDWLCIEWIKVDVIECPFERLAKRIELIERKEQVEREYGVRVCPW